MQRMLTHGLQACTAAVLGMAAPALAEEIIGLTATQQLVRFDSANPSMILSTSPAISGVSPGDSIADIDVYPVNGLLHGIGGATGNLYRINPLTGVAVLDVVPQASIGNPTDIDFNPTVDRLRVFSAGDLNFRLTPSVNTAGPTGAGAGAVNADGMLAYVGGTPNPNLVGNAYTNNFDGAATTTLYSIDADTDMLVVHSVGPQFSTLANVGPLGANVGNLVGFDISGLSGLAFVSNGNSLFTADLGSGALTPIGTIGSPTGGPQIVTIAAAAVPEPGTLAGLLVAAAPLTRRRS